MLEDTPGEDKKREVNINKDKIVRIELLDEKPEEEKKTKKAENSETEKKELSELKGN
ncbi:MAG: hypothetical protein QXO16_03200 [Archaeoglobaceae archaeon]